MRERERETLSKVKIVENNLNSNLDLLEGDLEGEGLIVVRVQCALLDAGLLLFQSLAVLHNSDLHVGICRGINERI